MAPSAEGLARFAEIFFQEFSQHLNQEEVERKARTLLNLYLAVYESPIAAVKTQLLTEENIND